MRKRVRRRYSSERWFRGLGLAAVGLSVLFLAFLIYSMASRGLGGFVHHEARLPIDFARSDLFLDPATLHGPDAAQIVAGAIADIVGEPIAVQHSNRAPRRAITHLSMN